MPPVPPVNMANIQAALAARMGMGNGIPMPLGAQMTQPSAPLPTGGPNTPGPGMPQMPIPGTPPVQNAAPPTGGASPTQQTAAAAQNAQSPLLDPETHEIAKALVQKLMKHL